MKTEPSTYSIDDLKRDKTTHWEGIRNYQARNFMMHDMSIQDPVLIYHSNAKPPGIVGLARVCSDPYPDFFAWDASSQYADPASTPEHPRWFMVDVAFEQQFSTMISLQTLKDDPMLADMLVVKKGVRLSIQPVKYETFQYIMNQYVL